ncbi:transcriptional regulator [Burkholderia cepacia]|uniref:sugar diacid recognition domain-containing protein n=1 Tax=Burkholderia cepacia TaxID=292 RepID=UPI000751B0A2|nr:sugar diacid recognition domain-containing protein [Burkholderia cepacia]KWB25125.1 transcriptional regulator [Burkholderia cepacia]
MMIDSHLATAIVERTLDVIPFDVNVMDPHGSILASSDVNRVGELHAGAQLALASARTVEIDADMAQRLHGVRPGVNLPLSVRGQLCGVIGVTGDPAEVRRFGELLRITAEMLLEREQLTHELRQNARHREAFVLQLIERRVAAAELDAWAQRLGIDCRLPRAAVVCRLTDVDANPETGVAQVERMQSQLADERPHQLTAKTSFRELVIFEPIDGRAVELDTVADVARKTLDALEAILSQWATQPFKLALGIAMDGVAGFQHSYQCALTTLRVGVERMPHRTTFSYYEFYLPVLLSGMSNSWQAQQLQLPLKRLLVQGRRSSLLLDTLKAWYASDGHPGSTAALLGIHRNTLDYRLQQISNLTRLDLSVMDDRLLLYIALQLGDR